MNKPAEHTVRTKFLQEVDGIINNDRAKSYGTAEDSFDNIANLWNAYLLAKGLTAELNALDIALMMDLMKTARLATNLLHKDSWIDKAGYSACGGGIAIIANSKSTIISKGIVNELAANTTNEGIAKPKPNVKSMYSTITQEEARSILISIVIEEGYKGKLVVYDTARSEYGITTDYYNSLYLLKNDFNNLQIIGFTDIKAI